ncbi:hypothetical protein F5J12DRAFT_539656 [Pisolithus orientalis]|uniref:uncharacterized protein n=1 Tax=Pisolithus orientalis TaxID=936130 RepID=UPI002224FD8F|nr:uncharacterized protein F5J12DRAFT_539656 [Pisolithus orientalis]KAI6012573.1 hypothetical protein F5J12DRAFT_539656 [Pisolithus orientalis]
MTYCFCDVSTRTTSVSGFVVNPSAYFHFTCIRLAVPPEGTWYCDACRARQKNAKRGARGNGKSVTDGGNSPSGGRKRLPGRHSDLGRLSINSSWYTLNNYHTRRAIPICRPEALVNVTWQAFCIMEASTNTIFVRRLPRIVE